MTNAMQSFLDLIERIAHTYDDVIDETAVAPERVHQLMHDALIGLQCNSFYREHQANLLPALVMAMVNWRIANRLEENGTEDDRRIAFIIRSSYVDIGVLSVYLTEGMDAAIEKGIQMRRYVHQEGFDAYMKGAQ